MFTDNSELIKEPEHIPVKITVSKSEKTKRTKFSIYLEKEKTRDLPEKVASTVWVYINGKTRIMKRMSYTYRWNGRYELLCSGYFENSLITFLEQKTYNYSIMIETAFVEILDCTEKPTIKVTIE